jgi:uncharacterized DUF497 family protein
VYPKFEWDDAKAAGNIRKHGVRFEDAVGAFRDNFAIDYFDDTGYGEDCFIHIGLSGEQLLTIVYTERADRIRIISARRSTKHEQEDYYSQVPR